MKDYLIVIEKTKNGFSAYSPDVDGCVAVGETKEECEINIKDALKFHIEFMIEKGYEIPKPRAKYAEFVKINIKKSKSKVLTYAE